MQPGKRTAQDELALLYDYPKECPDCKAQYSIVQNRGLMICNSCAVVYHSVFGEEIDGKDIPDDDDSSTSKRALVTCTAQKTQEHQHLVQKVMSKVIPPEEQKKHKRAKQTERSGEWYDLFFGSLQDSRISGTYLPLSNMKVKFEQIFRQYQPCMYMSQTFEKHTYAACIMVAWCRSPDMNILIGRRLLAEYITQIHRVIPDAKVLSVYKEKDRLDTIAAASRWETREPFIERKSDGTMMRYKRDANGIVYDSAIVTEDEMVDEAMAGVRVEARVLNEDKDQQYQKTKLVPTKEEAYALSLQADEDQIKGTENKIKSIESKIAKELKLAPLTRLNHIIKHMRVFAYSMTPVCDKDGDWPRIELQAKYVFKQMKDEAKTERRVMCASDITIAATIMWCAFKDTYRNGGKFTKVALYKVTGVSHHSINICSNNIKRHIPLVITDIEKEEDNDDEEEEEKDQTEGILATNVFNDSKPKPFE